MLFLQALLFFAWQGTAALSWAEQAEGIQVAVVTGISNTWKVGFPTRHRVTITSGKPFRGTVELQTVDGDGSSVRYRDSGWIVECTENEPFSIEIIAKHGRSNRPIRIDLFDDQHKLLTQHALRDSERGTAIAANQPWLVGIGSPRLDLGQGAIKSAQGALVEFSLSEIDRADELPNHPAAYSGVDTILFSSSNHALNQSISKEQRQAMETYLRNGGQMVLTWGAGGPELANYSEFSNVLPGQLVSVAEGCEPGAIESLLGSQDQLDPLRCSVLKLNRGRIDVVTAASDRSKLPFIARWAYGTGSVVWMATELDCDEVLPWNTRPALLKYLLKDHWEKSEGRASKQSFQGYDDLAGQLNAMLDTFPNLRLGNLGHLVLIAVLFALCIGPLDYFLVSKGWKRPRWTWWTLGLASAGTMLTSYLLAQAWKPELPSINQLEFVDYDDQTQLLRGRGFIHAYAGRRGLYDFSSQHRSFASNRSAESPLLPNRIDWFGQPGKGLGGFDSNVTTQLGLPAYTIDAQSASSSEVIGLGFPAAGTKALQTEWTESIGSQNLLNGLGTVSGKDDLLQGSFANPLGVELENAILYFAGRAYTVPARIRPGEKVAISTSIPKDITRRLQRRAFVAGEEQGVEWNPGDTDSIERLAELVSFHRSAGGPSYTGLYHRYLSALEASDLLKLERAILFAQVSEPATSWTLRRNGIPLKAEGGKSRTVVRIVLTVENNSKNSLLMQNDSRLNIP
jgi:hypothetical protein